ncbi:MAG: hypothetical protein AAF433_12330 [Bacteroidota bacterium]
MILYACNSQEDYLQKDWILQSWHPIEGDTLGKANPGGSMMWSIRADSIFMKRFDGLDHYYEDTMFYSLTEGRFTLLDDRFGGDCEILEASAKTLVLDCDLSRGVSRRFSFGPYRPFNYLAEADTEDLEALIENLKEGYWVEEQLGALLEFGSYGEIFTANQPTYNHEKWRFQFVGDDLFIEISALNQAFILQLKNWEKGSLRGRWFAPGVDEMVTFTQKFEPVIHPEQLYGTWAFTDSTRIDEQLLYEWEEIGDFYPGYEISFNEDRMIYHRHFFRDTFEYALSPLGKTIICENQLIPWDNYLRILEVSEEELVIERCRRIPHPDGWWERVELKRVGK